RLFERVHQEQMAHEPDLDANRFAFELLDGFNAGLGDDHVVAVAVVVDNDGNAGRPAAARDQRIAVGDGHSIDLACREGVHRGHVLEPTELDGYAFFLEPSLLNAYLPGDPSRPITVRNLERGTARFWGSGLVRSCPLVLLRSLDLFSRPIGGFRGLLAATQSEAEQEGTR